MFSLLSFFILTALSYLGVHLILHYAQRRQILDHPNVRSSHAVPTPRGGGAAIALLVLGLGVWAATASGSARGLIYLIGAGIIAWLGWRDDLHSLSPRV